MGQWLRLHTSNAGDTSSVCSQGTKIPHPEHMGKKIYIKKKRNKKCWGC